MNDNDIYALELAELAGDPDREPCDRCGGRETVTRNWGDEFHCMDCGFVLSLW